MKTTATKVRISILQLNMMIIALTASFGHFVYVHIAIHYAGRDAWVSLLLGALLGSVIVFLQISYAAHPNLSLVAYTKLIFGKWFGTLITILYIVFFVGIVGITLKTVTDFMGIIYPTTPPAVFVIALLLVASWACMKGLEVIVRTVQFVLPMLLLLGILASILSIKDKNPALLLPIMNSGWSPVWRGALVFVTMFSEMIVFGMFASDVEHPEKLKKSGMWLVLILLIMFIGPVTGPIMLFGEHLAQALAFPTYTEIQYIHLGNVVERFDIIGVLLWSVGSFFRISVFLFAACKGVAQLCDAKESDFTIPVTLITGGLTLSIMRSSREEVYHFLGNQYLYIVLITGIALPVLTQCVYLIRKSKLQSKLAPQK